MIRRGRHRERGAALVEMAVTLPFLVLILLGTIESAWALSSLLDTRHAVREGARLAVVDAGDENEIITETCGRLKTAIRVNSQVALTRPDPAFVGSDIEVRVRTTHSDLGGLLPFFDGIVFDEVVTMRLEITPSWNTTALTSCAP